MSNSTSTKQPKPLLTTDNINSAAIYLFITLGIIARLLPHPANFTPLAAIALFAGTYLGRRSSIFVVIAAMLISDYFLGFHSTMPYVYGSFLVIILLGTWLKNHFSAWSILGASVAGSLLFFLVTNFGAWLHMPLYPKTFTGLMEAYAMGIPFYRGVPADQAFMFLRNTLLGDLFYAGVFFGVYEAVKTTSARYLSHT